MTAVSNDIGYATSIMVGLSRHHGKSFVALVYFVLCGCALIVDLPDAIREPSEGDAGPSGGGGTAAHDAMADVTRSSGGSGASGGGSAGQPSTGGGCAVECDCDGDRSVAEGVCGGDDCDDDDPDVHPGQTEYFTVRSPTVGFDYDCKDGPQQDPDLAKVAPACILDLLGSCPVNEYGYVNAIPACGERGAWATCKTQVPAGCVASIVDTMYPMACH